MKYYFSQILKKNPKSEFVILTHKNEKEKYKMLVWTSQKLLVSVLSSQFPVTYQLQPSAKPCQISSTVPQEAQPEDLTTWPFGAANIVTVVPHAQNDIENSLHFPKCRSSVDLFFFPNRVFFFSVFPDLNQGTDGDASV